MKRATIFGSGGLLGTELLRTKPSSISDIQVPTSRELDLRLELPDSLRASDVWINCAAKVGGVKANTESIADFYLDNIRIGSNVIDAARKLKVGKLVSVLSTCIYPDAPYVKYPLTEDQLHAGPPHQSNFGYAYAKRMLDVHSRACRQQHGSNFITLVPNNLYGPNDNWDYESSHVIPALIRKFYEATVNGTDVTVWGSGEPLREFTFAEDAARIIWWCAEHYDGFEPLNIGNNDEISIADLASEVACILGFRGSIKFDKTKPDGQLRKPTSNDRLRQAGCTPKYTSLTEGLEKTIDHFVKNYPNLRNI
jgi:GDP-L-fucose synthase